jgi:putative addiction module component (TIGR02574 family)
MSATLKSLGIDRLDLDEQIELVEAIWDDIAARHIELPLPTPEQKSELDRRLIDHDANPDAVVS